MILVGNKSDIADRKVTVEEGKELANKYNMTFLETSAKTSENVKQSFFSLIKEIKTKVKGTKPSGKDGKTTLGKGQSVEKKPGCC